MQESSAFASSNHAAHSSNRCGKAMSVPMLAINLMYRRADGAVQAATVTTDTALIECR
jgi:hypothetical protein